MMQSQRTLENQQSMTQSGQISGSLSFNGTLTKEDEEMSKSALSTFRAKEEEIEKKKMEVKEKVQAQLGRIEEETKRLATIREVSPSLPPSLSRTNFVNFEIEIGLGFESISIFSFFAHILFRPVLVLGVFVEIVSKFCFFSSIFHGYVSFFFNFFGEIGLWLLVYVNGKNFVRVFLNFGERGGFDSYLSLHFVWNSSPDLWTKYYFFRWFCPSFSIFCLDWRCYDFKNFIYKRWCLFRFMFWAFQLQYMHIQSQ